MKAKVITSKFETFIEFSNSDIAKQVYDSLPIEGEANFWGGEVYVDVPIMLEGEYQQDEVEIGDFAYWPRGPSVCFFFGQTPSSFTDKPRPHSPVEVIGKIKDPLLFHELKSLEKVRIEKVE